MGHGLAELGSPSRRAGSPSASRRRQNGKPIRKACYSSLKLYIIRATGLEVSTKGKSAGSSFSRNSKKALSEGVRQD